MSENRIGKRDILGVLASLREPNRSGQQVRIVREEPSHACDAESSAFKKSANLGGVVALEFDFALAHCASAAAGLAGFAGEVFDFGL